jgi:hypothetical protein
MEFGNIVRVETLRYLTKITTLRRSRRFLQPSIRLRYNYFAQLVAIKRGRMRVPNLKFWSPRRWKLVVHITVVKTAGARELVLGYLRPAEDRLYQLTQTLGEKIHLTSCKLLSQLAAGTATPKPISDWRRSLIYAAGVSACASFSSQL